MSAESRQSAHAVARALERWFARHARDLPWRRRRTGYAALVSEAMLQQTQVARVIDRYRAFMRRFPTLRALARADEQEVLAEWQGLGYYRRARHLHAAARMIVTRHGGRVPRDVSALRELPGVGRYTAGAIASMVHGERQPIVDGNVRRVLARIEARRDVGTEGDGWAWEAAGRLVSASTNPGALNEALMELGATVCTPGARPTCSACPVARWCEARRLAKQDEIPPPSRPPRRSVVYVHAVVVRRGPSILVEQRREDGLWSRMWQPPTIESPRRLGPAAIRAALRVPIDRLRRRATFEHLTSHRVLRFTVYETTSRARRGEWRRPGDLGDLAMSNAHRRAIECVVAVDGE